MSTHHRTKSHLLAGETTYQIMESVTERINKKLCILFQLMLNVLYESESGLAPDVWKLNA
jgi:hypothetical protein